MIPRRCALAALLVVFVLIALPVPAGGSGPRIVASLTVAPDAVLPGETAEIRLALDVSGGDEPTRLGIAGEGLAGLVLVSESTNPSCTRIDWTWTCSPPWPGRQTLNLTVRVPDDHPWATAHAMIFGIAHPGGFRWAIAGSLWILGTRVHLASETVSAANGTSVQAMVLNVTGPGPAAQLWLSALPESGATITAAQPTPTALNASAASWFRENLTRGLYRFDMLLACPAGACGAQATLAYADTAGHVLPTEQVALPSAPAPGALPASESTGFVPLALLAPGAAVIAFLVGAHWLGYEVLPTPERYRSPREVYLISKSGTLLAHRRRSGTPARRDEDILAGMFTAVREFVRDTMEAAPKGLVVLSVGEERVTFVEGRQAVVALVGAGRVGRGTVAQAKSELARLESVHGPELERWDGTCAEVAEASDSIADLLLR